MLLWLLVDGLRLPIWVAQGIAMLLTVIVSYLGHARFHLSPLLKRSH